MHGWMDGWVEESTVWSSWESGCLSPYELLKQSTMDWVAYIQITFSHSSGGWKSEIKVLADSVPGERPFPGSVVFWLFCFCLAITAHGGRGQGSLWSLSDEGTNPFLEGSTLMISSPPKGLASKYPCVGG